MRPLGETLGGHLLYNKFALQQFKAREDFLDLPLLWVVKVAAAFRRISSLESVAGFRPTCGQVPLQVRPAVSAESRRESEHRGSDERLDGGYKCEKSSLERLFS